MWLARLEGNTPQIISSLRHQEYGKYWSSRAIAFERIRCPFYAVGGWADGSYVGAVDEALRRLKVPRKGLIGPWGHRFPHLAVPGPAIGFLQETLRWFDSMLVHRDPSLQAVPLEPEFDFLRDDPRYKAWEAKLPWNRRGPGPVSTPAEEQGVPPR